jgi:hypothetical protein
VTRRRILLAELTPRIPLPQIFSTWNPLVNAANITFTDADLTASKTATHATAWMCALGYYVKDYGVWYWETTHNFTGAADVIAGVATIDFDLVSMPGAAFPVGPPVNYSIGGPDKAGDCRFNGVVTGNAGAVADGDVVRHWLDLDAGVYRVAVNGGAWLDVLTWTEQGRGLFAVVGLKRPVGTTASATANFGQNPFEYTPPDGANPGVYTEPSAPTTIYIGSEGFDATIDGSPVHFAGRLAGDQDVEIEREGSCWVWGDQTVSRRGQLVVINNDGALNAWRSYLWRDAGVLLRSGWEGDAYEDFVPWAYSRGDSIELTRDKRIILSLADPLAWLDRPLQTTLYPDDQANLQLAGQPLPIVYGKPLYCTPAKLSTVPAERDYQLHDSTGADALDSIASVFDSGDIFNGPDDAFVAHDAVTSSNGGNFGGWTGTPALPANWILPPGAGTFTASDKFEDGGGGFVHCLSVHAPDVKMQHNGAGGDLRARTLYRITFTCSSIISPGALIFRAPGSPDTSILLTTTGAKSVALYVRDATRLQMVMHGDGISVYINTLRVSAEQVIDWTYWGGTRGITLANSPYGKIVANPEGTLTGLEQFVADICTRVDLPDIEIDGVVYTGFSAVTALSVQARNSYYLIDEYVDKPITALELLRWLMNGWCGCAVPNRLGIIDFKKVIEPSNTPVLTLDSSNIQGKVIVTTDRAKGLTIRLAGAKNHTVHSATDIATGVPEDLAAALQSEWGITVEGASDSAIPVSSAYTAAISAKAQGTPIRLRSDLQAEANRVATLWRPTREFYELTALLSASEADALEYADTVRLVDPDVGLEAGKNVLVKRVRSRFFGRRVDLKLWA